MKEKRYNIANRIHGFLGKLSSYIVLILALILSFSLVKNISNVKSVEKMISDKEAEVEEAKKETEDLEKRLEYIQSQEFIEKQLRDKLGLAKEGETVVILPPPEILRTFAPEYVQEDEKLPDPNWRKWIKLFI